MTIKNLYPPNRPFSIYNVINGRPELPVTSTFSRNSAASYVDAKSTIAYAEANAARFTYDPSNGEFLGLLLEEESRQLCPQTVPATPYWSFNDCIASTPTDVVAPDGTKTVTKITVDHPVYGRIYCPIISWDDATKGYAANSIFCKAGSNGTIKFRGIGNVGGINFNMINGTFGADTDTNCEWTRTEYPDGWWRVEYTSLGIETQSIIYFEIFTENGDDFYVWGAQQEKDKKYVSSYMPKKWDDGAVIRLEDNFSLLTTSNFDKGFSLLLDSETTTEDFIYKINASGSPIASLSNDAGTLKWEINGVSAQSKGDYPQVGFSLGRVRTISSYTAAGDGINPNYLYTSGLSFPTITPPASGADELQFGTPQTVKAVYVWNGQLDSTQAVSVIKGDNNVIPNIPVDSQKYVFIYDTDPSLSGNVDISISSIIPTNVSGGMTYDWGDGSPIRPYNKGVIPSHTYPYPGQYRLQISGNETWDPAGNISGTLTSGGFDNIRLSDTQDTIRAVESWPPQFRTTTSSEGFTGDQLGSMLYKQRYLDIIPRFKYKDLTNVSSAFTKCYMLQAASIDGGVDWDWVPVELKSAETLSNTFEGVGRNVTGDSDNKTFPQLQTSEKLKNVSYCFASMRLKEFPTNGLPWSDTSEVRNWEGAFYDCELLEELGTLDTSSATNMSETFRNCAELKAIPTGMNTSNVSTFNNTFRDCKQITTIPSMNYGSCEEMINMYSNCTNVTSISGTPNTSNVRTISGAWTGCTSLTSFPLIDTSECTDFTKTWQSCSSLSIFPPIDTSKALSLNAAWYYCTGLTEFPSIITSANGSLSYTWRDCFTLQKVFPFIDTSENLSFYQTWYGCSNLPGPFPKLDYSLGTNFYYCWYSVQKPGTEKFEFAQPFKAWIYGEGAWYNNILLEEFPANAFDTTGVLNVDAFKQAWTGCKLNAISIANILESFVVNGATGITAGLDGGSNADYNDWTSGTKDYYELLCAPLGTPISNSTFPSEVGRGWDMTINDSTNSAPYTLSAKSGFFVNHSDGMITCGEIKPGVSYSSGKTNQEVFETEQESIERLLELNPDYFPEWDREINYIPGQRVNFRGSIYKCLQELQAREFELPEGVVSDEVEIATPKNRTARWAEVYDPFKLNEEESNGRPVQRSAQSCN